MAKVIHVHLTHPIEGTRRRDWYFSSIKAVFSVFTADQVGATYNSCGMQGCQATARSSLNAL